MDLFIEGFRGAMQLIIARDSLVIDAAVRSLTISTLAVAAAAIVGIPVASCLAMHRFFGRRLIVLLFRAGMSVPTVFIGLMCFGMFSRKGPSEISICSTRQQGSSSASFSWRSPSLLVGRTRPFDN